MNKSSSFAVVLTLATLAAGSAFAQSSGAYAVQSGVNYGDVVVAHPGKSIKSRDQVRAELAAARVSGEYSVLIVGGDYRDAFASQVAPSTKTRAEVQAELSTARNNGEYAVLNAGDNSDRFVNM
ncbi:MAG: DUF4148 domain-containing protein [Pseudomonadota bacterium]|uniref:DUF4148 domain-containing protein n=1 Tax=Polaromonas sp. TaxID=1869339 RepID=UPI00181CB356|nr:DUF4148 domain-containing protein [Polaromonas sp.]MBA3595001.1 DUF4148 domain-containing protein [Polaromonas sp.]MDQ3271249.1 DUF4148 domain-containing protein [Pseudomonadota bacterium]